MFTYLNSLVFENHIKLKYEVLNSFMKKYFKQMNGTGRNGAY